MSAARVVSNLVALGVQVKDAWNKSGKDWGDFLGSGEFAAIQGSVRTLLGGLTPNDLKGAVRAIREKEKTFLRGREITALSVDELAQFSALSDVQHQLVNKLLKAPPEAKGFLGVLMHDVLPVLLSLAKVVVRILV